MMVTKKEFFEYMSYLYEEDYKDNETYKTLKSIMNTKNKTHIKDLKELIIMNRKERLAYRHAMAANGKELTPLQVDQYLSMIEFALSHMNVD